MGFVRLKLKEANTDTVYDTFINTDAINFITEYFDKSYNDYIMMTEVEFQESEATFRIYKYIVLGETMDSIAKKLGLEGK